ncbi:MAG: hypothetical protein WHS87_03550 [Anaerolineales bacterium]
MEKPILESVCALEEEPAIFGTVVDLFIKFVKLGHRQSPTLPQKPHLHSLSKKETDERGDMGKHRFYKAKINLKNRSQLYASRFLRARAVFLRLGRPFCTRGSNFWGKVARAGYAFAGEDVFERPNLST